MDRISESHEAAGNRPGTAVNGSLNYIEPTSEKPVYYAYEPPAGTPRSTGKFVAHTVPIRNAREVVDHLSLDRQGFQLTHQESAVRDFYDQNEVKSIYYPEVERLLKQATGAEKVVIFDHQVRNAELAKRGEKNAREYGRAATMTTPPSPVRGACAIICRQPKLKSVCRIALPKSTYGVRFADRSNRRRSPFAIPARSSPRTSFPPTWFTATRSARPIDSPTTRIIDGSTSRSSSAMK